ncbi:hypothetical protein C4K17_3394 [Pseudomonas chlororaphis subsp. aurantiaca]|nr:hypothetical protein C4K17_3394 [Pseudomonas chlororaphis subsp. aurantiaca]
MLTHWLVLATEVSGEQSSNRASHKTPGARGPVAAAAGCDRLRSRRCLCRRRKPLRAFSQPAAAATGIHSALGEQVDLLMRCWLGNSCRRAFLRPAR